MFHHFYSQIKGMVRSYVYGYDEVGIFEGKRSGVRLCEYCMILRKICTNQTVRTLQSEFEV